MDQPKQNTTQVLSFGDKAAGVTFNPSQDPFVDEVKRYYSTIITVLDAARSRTDNLDKKRYYSKAISYAEDSQMNAVKAITWQH